MIEEFCLVRYRAIMLPRSLPATIHQLGVAVCGHHTPETRKAFSRTFFRAVKANLIPLQGKLARVWRDLTRPLGKRIDVIKWAWYWLGVPYPCWMPLSQGTYVTHTWTSKLRYQESLEYLSPLRPDRHFSWVICINTGYNTPRLIIVCCEWSI
jgi:hypothetical protein